MSAHEVIEAELNLVLLRFVRFGEDLREAEARLDALYEADPRRRPDAPEDYAFDQAADSFRTVTEQTLLLLSGLEGHFDFKLAPRGPREGPSGGPGCAPEGGAAA